MRGGHDTTRITSAVTLGTVQETPPPRTRTPPDSPCLWDGSTHPQNNRPPPSPPAAPQRSQPHFVSPVPTSDSFRCPLKSSRPLAGGCAAGCPIRALPTLGFGFGAPPAASSMRCALRAPPRTWGPRLAPRPPAPIGCSVEGAGLGGGHTSSPRPAIGWGWGSIGVLGCRGGTVETKDTGNKGCWGGGYVLVPIEGAGGAGG